MNLKSLSIKATLKQQLLLFLIVLSLSLQAQKVSYTHQDKSLQEITNLSIEWENYDKPIYNGLDNGIYWFKIELDKNTPQILNIPESHISRTNLYHEGTEIEREHSTRYITYILDNTQQPYYLKVNCLLEGRIPIKIEDTHLYYKSELKKHMIIGLYIGLVICIILFNLFSYISFKEITYIYYVFMVIGMAINALYKDGVTALLFGIESFNETHETTFTSIVVISSIFFSTSFLSLKTHLPTLRKVGIFIVIISVISNITYQVTNSFPFFITTNILYLLALDIFWFSSILLWNKSSSAKFFAIAYGIPLLFAHDYYICPHLGIRGLNLPLDFYKLGSLFEMVIFTYAIFYKSKALAIENKNIRAELQDYANKLKALLEEDNNKNTTTSDELIEQYAFTIREIEILKKVADKKTNKQIAAELFISENTVKFHIRNILQKLEVKNRKAASNKYLKLTNKK